MVVRKFFILIQKFHLLWTFRWRLPSFSTLDEWLAMRTGNTARCSNSWVASINSLTFLMNFWWRLDQNPQENNLATQLLLHLAVFPVLIASHSSSVKKDGSLHQNVHSKWNFRISIKNFITKEVRSSFQIVIPVNFRIHWEHKSVQVATVVSMLLHCYIKL